MSENKALSVCKEKIDHLWEQQSLGYKAWKQDCLEDRSLYLANELIANQDEMRAIRNSFREWSPLRVYTSWTDSSKLEFSLRFKGQKVAVLKKGADGKMFLKFDSKLKKTNQKCFDFEINETGTTTWEWQASEAKEFREHFKRIFTKIGEYKHVKSTKKTSETHVESLIIEEMIKTSSSDKFAGSLRGLQPVLFAKAPFQFPVPFSASGGDVTLGNGNIDVLARVNQSRLAVWELKRPKENLSCNAHIQAYSYALSLLKMLRSPHGKEWYKILGYSGSLPDSITIEAVPVLGEISESKQAQIIMELEQFVQSNAEALQVGKDRIDYKLVFYSLAENEDKLDPRNVSIDKAYSFQANTTAGGNSHKATEIGPSWNSSSQKKY